MSSEIIFKAAPRTLPLPHWFHWLIVGRHQYELEEDQRASDRSVRSINGFDAFDDRMFFLSRIRYYQQLARRLRIQNLVVGVFAALGAINLALWTANKVLGLIL